MKPGCTPHRCPYRSHMGPIWVPYRLLAGKELAMNWGMDKSPLGQKPTRTRRVTNYSVGMLGKQCKYCFFDLFAS